MTETKKPPACHYDRTLGARVTNQHRDDCPTQNDDTPGACPAAGRGCAPCTAPHCVVCGREHTNNDHPVTCPECLGLVRQDLADIAQAVDDLATEALDAGADGRLVAAAPIPGGNAAVLLGPSVRLDQMRTGRKYTTTDMAEVHHHKDPTPPLIVLAWWEDVYRTWHGHELTTSGRIPTQDAHAQAVLAALEVRGRASVAGAIAYLDGQLDHIANHTSPGAPDWIGFTKQIQTLRAQLERALHNEREPEEGVACFECGDALVRRFRDAKRCRHSTPARVELRRALVRQRDGQSWLRVVASYPELGISVEPERAAARGPSASLVAAARRPCAACVNKQGGIDDPTSGRSWECPGCRKEYSIGEYVTATRRDLLERGDQGAGWTHIRMAAEAASTLVGMQVLETTVRKWMDTGKVAGLCEWTPGVPWGQRLVFWPDVAGRATELHERALAAEERRRARAELEKRFWRLAGENPKMRDARAIAKRLGIDKRWLQRLLDTVAA